MKAEQRKELETNSLADRMGRMMQTFKSGERRTFLIYTIAAVFLIVGAFLGYRWYTNRQIENSERWQLFYDGALPRLSHLARNEDETPAGKAARLQIAWLLYWELGIKGLGSFEFEEGKLAKERALANISEAALWYTKLAEDCKDDPVFEPQAMLGVAVVYESLAVQDPVKLRSAESAYGEVVAKYPDSAEGKYAQQRLDIMKDPTRRAELEKSYEGLSKLLVVPRMQPALMPNDPIHKGLFEKK